MPLSQSWIELENTIGRPTLKGTPDEIKQQGEGLNLYLQSLRPPKSDKITTQDGSVEGIGYRIYRPNHVSTPLPIAIWAHGGGFMIGDLNVEDHICQQVSERTMTIVISIDYSLTPDFKWPTQLNEMFSVYKWAHDNASTIGGDATKMFTGGSSCGAQLALNVCDRVLRDPSLKSSMKGVASLGTATCPPHNCPEKYKSDYTAMLEYATNNPVVDAESMEIFLRELGQREDDPEFWVLLATDNHKNYPPVYLASCEFDPLRDDSRIFAKALAEVGVPTKHDYYAELPHYFWVFPNLLETQDFVDNLVDGVQWLQSQA